MAENILLLASFLLFMFFFAGVGLASMRVKEDTTDDYLVAGRGMHPALAALSAVSTWNSGYMFIGFIGFIFLNGYSAIWIAVVSTIGQLVAWIWLYKYIQKQGEERGIRSLSSLVSNTTGSPEAKTAAVLSVLFLSIYAAAQLTAGGVALEVMLNWPPAIGILIGFVLVVAYCYAGGIRASIWTDAAQSCVMIVGSLILCFVAIKGSGGFSGLHNELKIIDPGMVNLFPSGLMFGATLWIAAFFLGGLGVAGQPQVVSRVMTLKDDKARKEAMVWFFVWQTPFIAIMFLIGLACRVLLPELGTSGAETGLPKLAMEQLNPFLGGLILASIFAATMSTADSQVLACTAAITDDVKPEWSQDHKTTKIVTLVVAAFATAISLIGQLFPGFGDSVFSLVVLAVYGLGAIFVPLLLVRMTGYEPDSTHTIAMMIAAMSSVMIWTILGFGDEVFPSVPGMGAAFATHFAFCQFRDESPDNPFGRFEISQEQRHRFAVVGVIALCFAGVAEGAYAVYGPDSDEGGDDGKVAMYQIDGNYTYHEIGTGTEVISDSTQVSASSDSVDVSDLNVVGYLIEIAHLDDEEACLPGATTEDDEVAYEGGIGDYLANNSGLQALMDSSVYWIDSELVGTSVEDSISSIDDQLNGGDVGLGEYLLSISVEVNSGGLPPLCQNEDSDESVTWRISLISLDYTLTEVKS